MREYFRDALRLLFLLVEGGEAISPPHATGAVRIFRGEARLHALDFWVRYPDYLAADLLDRFERQGNAKDLDLARRIMELEEPDLRRVPMIRYLFGAYDPIDTAMSILVSHRLASLTGRKSGGKVQETDFLVMPRGVALTEEAVGKAPVLEWYAERARVVVDLAGNRTGAALKEAQYQRSHYAGTEHGAEIPSIKEVVAARLAATARGRK
jgi:hypothetical protein